MKNKLRLVCVRQKHWYIEERKKKAFPIESLADTKEEEGRKERGTSLPALSPLFFWLGCLKLIYDFGV